MDPDQAQQKPSAGERAKEEAKGVAKAGAKKAGKELGKKALQRVGGQAALTAGRAAIANPVGGAVAAGVAIALFIIALIIIIIILLAAVIRLLDDKDIKVNKSASASSAKVGDEITYTLHVTDPNSVLAINIQDKIPDGTDFISSPGTQPFQYIYDPVNKIVKFHIGPGLPPPAPQVVFGPIDQTFTFTVKANRNNNYVYNTATAEGIKVPGTKSSSSGSVTTAEYVPPSLNPCGAKYALDMLGNDLLNKNFGDPNCDVSESKIDELFKKLDPDHAPKWHTMVKGESGFDPNAWLSPSGGTPDPHGAWGLLQMGSSTYDSVKHTYTGDPGAPPPAQGMGGQYDRGDVNWQVQITNAIIYANETTVKAGTHFCGNHVLSQDTKLIDGLYLYWQAACPLYGF